MKWSLLIASIFAPRISFAQTGSQVPPVILKQVMDVESRFIAVLHEECGDDICFPVGCQVGRFEILDNKPTSSLPGLDEAAPAGEAQYKLMSTSCEFTYEPSLAKDKLASLRKRLSEKVKLAGTTVQILARELPSKAQAVEAAPQKQIRDLPPQEALLFALIPFVPWFVIILLVCLVMIIVFWGLRSGVKGQRRRDPGTRTRASDVAAPNLTQHDAEPTPHMLISRINQMQAELNHDQYVLESTLKRYFDEENYDELCRILHHFGSDVLNPLKSRKEYVDRLAQLSTKYRDFEFNDEPAEIWKFMNRLERYITAAKVSIDHQPLEEAFSFLASINVEAFLEMLREVSEAEAVAAVAYSPRNLRERFFAQANPTFTAKFIEQLTSVDRYSDHFVRETANKLRTIYEEKGQNLRSIKVDRMPLLEQALNALEPNRRREVFLDLGRDNPDFITQVAPAIFLDECLLHVNSNILNELFLTVTPREGAAYLAQFEWGVQIIDKLNPRLKEGLQNLRLGQGQASPNLIISARKKISEFIRSKDQNGEVKLQEINARIIRNS